RLQFLFDGRASGGEEIGAFVERRLAHVVHLSIDIGTRGVQFLIVLSGRSRGLLRRRISELARAANRSSACIDDAQNRLEHQRVEQVRAQQQETDDPKGGYVRR